MPRKKKDPNHETASPQATGEAWSKRLDHVRKLRRSKRTFNNAKDWERAQRLFRGKHYNNPDGGDGVAADNPRERITVNLTRSHVEDFVAFLVNRAPLFMGKARSVEAVPRVRRKLALLNYFWTEQEMQKQFRRSVRDGCIYGRGVIKTGYTLEVDRAVDPSADGTINYDEFIREDHPYIRRVNPNRFFIDPRARDQDLATARWCAEDFFISRGDLLANATYDADIRAKVGTGTLKPRTMREYLVNAEAAEAMEAAGLTEDDGESSDDLILCTEVWDKKFQQQYVFLGGCEDAGPLFQADWPYDYLDGFPYEVYVFGEEPDEESGHGIPLLVEDQQLELDRVRTHEFQHRRRFANRKYAVSNEAMDAVEIKKFENGPDGAIVKEKRPGALRLIEQGNMPPDNSYVESRIRDDFGKILGADQLLQGGMLASRTTAAEVRARESIIGLKVESRIQGVDDFLNAIARQVAQHVEAHFTKQRLVRVVVGQNDAYEPVTPEDVKAEADLEMQSTTKPREDAQMERQQALMVMQTVFSALPLLQGVGSRISPEAVFLWAMGKFKDVELDALLAGQLPPPPAEGAGVASPPALGGASPASQAGAASVGPESMAMAAMSGGLSAGAQ